jgi:hypothetical protein
VPCLVLLFNRPRRAATRPHPADDGDIMIEKTCLVAGCVGYPCFGFGLSKWLNRKMLWACGAHRIELNTAAKGASGAAADVAPQRSGVKSAAVPQPVSHPSQQGSLL